MFGTLLKGAAEKLVLFGTSSTLVLLGSLGAVGALPSPGVALAGVMELIGVSTPSDPYEIDTGFKASIGTSETITAASIGSSSRPTIEELLKPTLLDLGVDLAFSSNLSPAVGFDAAKAHVNSWCSKALESLSTYLTQQRDRSSEDGYRSQLDAYARRTRADLLAICTRVLSHADQRRAQLQSQTLPPISIPVHSRPIEAPIPDPESRSNEYSPPDSNNNPPTEPLPVSPQPTPTTDPPSTVPNSGDSAPGSGWDYEWGDEHSVSAQFATVSSQNEMNPGHAARVHL